MPRTPVYDRPAVQAHYADGLRAKTEQGGSVTARVRRAARIEAEKQAVEGDGVAAAATEDLPTKDGYLSKIAKYVPAESVTVTTLAFAAFKPDGNTIWLYVAGGAIANMFYLYATALSTRNTTPPPRAYFYVLSCGAFALWAIAVIDIVQHRAGITGEDAEAQKTFVLAAAAFVVPLLDSVANQIKLKVPQATS
jgi:hypothetical protein